ncbi:type II toxin-antitoxin system HicA family toxin [Brachybacterium rhamnosum]|uniref:Type II toxin-antitoxin system HicA family toxin n=1 Tax=Brachybacterium rhamnosum TaxID=173361 RepID=A0ABW4Q0H0_9MICO
MVAAQDTRKVEKMLRKAGFTITKNPSGSHTTWGHPDGRSIPVPTGHRTISPGVYRKILDILKEER